MDSSPHHSWFYSENGSQQGPITFSELQQKIASGQLPSSSLVWNEGMTDWVAANTIESLTTSTSGSLPEETPSRELKNETPPETPIPLDIGFCIVQGWKQTFANFGNIMLLGLVYLAILIGMEVVFGLGSMALGEPLNDETATGIPKEINGAAVTYQLVTSLIQNFVSLFLSLGLARYGLNLIQGETPEISVLFSQSGKILTALGATILFLLMAVVGIFLFIIPGIIVLIRFGYYLQLIVEKDLGAIDSLQYSWRLTRKNGFPLFGLAILNFLIVIAGALCCVIGLIVALPVTWLASLLAYRFLQAGTKGILVRP